MYRHITMTVSLACLLAAVAGPAAAWTVPAGNPCTSGPATAGGANGQAPEVGAINKAVQGIAAQQNPSTQDAMKKAGDAAAAANSNSCMHINSYGSLFNQFDVMGMLGNAWSQIQASACAAASGVVNTSVGSVSTQVNDYLTMPSTATNNLIGGATGSLGGVGGGLSNMVMQPITRVIPTPTTIPGAAQSTYMGDLWNKIIK